MTTIIKRPEKELKLVSDDRRRALYEFAEDNEWRCAKYLEIKCDCVVGGHYHLMKDECFLLVSGMIEQMLLADKDKKDQIIKRNIAAPFVITIPRGTYHEFKIKAGSKLIGLMSETYNQGDDHT